MTNIIETIMLSRWVATITYRHDDHDETKLVTFEEISDLHDIIEAGPNFYAIVNIAIQPTGRCAPRTVEMDSRPEFTP